MIDFGPQADLSSSWALDEPGARPRIEDALERADGEVGDVLEHIPLGDGTGSLALFPTAYERLRRQTAHLLAGDGGELARLLGALRDRFEVAVVDTPAGDTVFGRQRWSPPTRPSCRCCPATTSCAR
jgi:chromosome partitioning protein